MLGAIVGVGVLIKVVQMPTDASVRLLTSALDQRGLEQPEADAATQVTQGRITELGGGDQPVDHRADLFPRGIGQRLALVQPALQQGSDDRNLIRGPLLGEEHPVDGLLEACTRLEVGHPVVPQGAGKPDPEGLRQILPLSIEGSKVRVEVLAWAVHLLVGRLLFIRRTVPREVAHICERGEESDLPISRLALVVPERRTLSEVLLGQRLATLTRDVVPGEQRVEVLEQQHRCSLGFVSVRTDDFLE